MFLQPVEDSDPLRSPSAADSRAQGFGEKSQQPLTKPAHSFKKASEDSYTVKLAGGRTDEPLLSLSSGRQTPPCRNTAGMMGQALHTLEGSARLRRSRARRAVDRMRGANVD